MSEVVWHPVLEFGFHMVDGKQIVCQMWISSAGVIEYRPVPMVELNEKRQPSIAGYLEDEDC